MLPKTIDRLISEALAIESEEAIEAGKLGFMARGLVQATMPHKSTSALTHHRVNGDYHLTISAMNPHVGLPYGSVPRLLLAWLATEAITTRSRDLVLGDSMSDFMRQLGMAPTGGRWGSIPRLKSQATRLFSSAIQCSYVTKDNLGHRTALQNMLIADRASLWWEPANPNQQSLFESSVRLSEAFYNEIIDNPVPIDMRALNALKRSPLALDIYCWLTYRMSYLKKPTSIPWESLQGQFGSGYALTSQGGRDFKKAFLAQLKKVQVVYPECNADEGMSGLLLRRSKTHIPKSLDL
jgi:hypothetical protein